MNPIANNASIANVILSKADLNTRFSNKYKSKIGSATWRSTVGKASKAARLTPKQTRERQELQPHSGAKESASVSSAKPAASKNAPNGSKRWRTVRRVCRSDFCDPTNAQIPSGTFTKKIHRQFQ